MGNPDHNILSVKVSEAKGGHIVSVVGECDISTAPVLKDVLQSLVIPAIDKPARVVVDLRGMTYMDSSAFWVLAAANRKVTERGGGLALVAGAGQPILRVIKLLNMDRIMGVFSTPEEALSNLSESKKDSVKAGNSIS
ncbi:MAG: STAS domain-containing protein [Candidatus Aquicultorales bacterium]